jgi:Mg-chelatase subunit ChlD
MDTLIRWRLILGAAADPAAETSLGERQAGMDQALELLYNTDRRGGLGSSSPKINRWLGDIRRFFPSSVVQVMQRDALERLGLRQLLLEPELLSGIEPDVHLVGALLSLKKVLPDKTRETAREVVRRVVEDLQRKLRPQLLEAVRAALQRADRNRRPRNKEIDWRRTLYANLKHYQPELRAIIPETIYGYGRKGHALRHIIFLTDQSGSMADSVVYAGIFGAVLASVRSLQTDLIAFDTAVVDLSEHLHDPVELLFGAQLGGGTDIAKALAFAQTRIRTPQDTILILLSDLYEGGNRQEMLKILSRLVQSGVRTAALLALSDEGAPAYDHENAAALAALGIPAFACTPDRFAELLSAAIAREDLSRWKNTIG